MALRENGVHETGNNYQNMENGILIMDNHGVQCSFLGVGIIVVCQMTFYANIKDVTLV